MGKHGEGWQLRSPTPRFRCDTAGGEIMVEIACVDGGADGDGDGDTGPCRLEFDQLFSSPMLGESSSLHGSGFMEKRGLTSLGV